MKPVSNIRTREVEAFLSFVSTADTERAVKARSFHVLGEFDADDFRRTSRSFLDANATASFAFLGRDIDEQGEIIEELDTAGHEVALHGHRHVMFGDLTYDTAHEDLSKAMDAIENATGIEPTGFFAPFKAVSEGTLLSAAELGLEWVLGRTDGDVPDDITLVDSVAPHDTRLLEGGESPEETFAELREKATGDKAFLFHPNLLEYYGATEEFDRWIDAVRPVPIGEYVSDGGSGVVLDCLRPVKVV